MKPPRRRRRLPPCDGPSFHAVPTHKKSDAPVRPFENLDNALAWAGYIARRFRQPFIVLETDEWCRGVNVIHIDPRFEGPDAAV